MSEENHEERLLKMSMNSKAGGSAEDLERVRRRKMIRFRAQLHKDLESLRRQGVDV